VTENDDSHERQGLDWRRLGAEAAAILVSILLAFAIDAAWGMHLDRRREWSYLERLRAEFLENREDLVQDRADRERIIGEFAYILGATAARDEASPREIGTRLRNLGGNFRFYSPTHAVLNEIIASGDLGLFRSGELREALLRYDEEHERLRGVETAEQEIQRNVVVPYLATHLETLPWQSDDDLRLIGVRPAPTQDPRRWLSDPAFQNMILLRWQRARTVQSYSAPVLTQVDRVLAVLDSVLANP